MATISRYLIAGIAVSILMAAIMTGKATNLIIFLALHTSQ